MSTMTIGATEKQIAFARVLLADRCDDVDAAMERAADKGWLATTKMCSAWIDQIKAQPRKHDEQGTREFVTPGFFAHDGVIYKVVPSRSSDRNYAMQMHRPDPEAKGSWVYARGAMFTLTEADRLTLEQAKAYGKTHGFCIVCGALLTDPESVERGIGPICAKKF